MMYNHRLHDNPRISRASHLGGRKLRISSNQFNSHFAAVTDRLTRQREKKWAKQRANRAVRFVLWMNQFFEVVRYMSEIEEMRRLGASLEDNVYFSYHGKEF